jgi:hypothetical protein
MPLLGLFDLGSGALIGFTKSKSRAHDSRLCQGTRI